MYFFDYEKVSREAGISAADLGAICRLVREDYPTDDMMFELRVMRTCRAIGEGFTTVDAVLKREEPAKA